MALRPLSALLETPPTLDLFDTPDGSGPGFEAAGNPTLLPTVVVDPAGLPPLRRGPGFPEPGPMVVWGWHVLRAADVAGAPAVYVDERRVDPREALLLALVLEGRRGSYRWEEMRRIVDYCREYDIDPNGEVSRLVTGDSGLLPRVERYRELSPALSSAVETAAVDLKSAERLSGIPEDLLVALLEVAGPLSHSNRRKLLSLVRELTKGRLMEPGPLKGEIERHREDPEKLLALLRRRRYPELSSMEERIDGFNREHLGGSGVALEAPANFEGRSFRVSFSFSNRSEYRSRLSALRHAEDHLEDILELL